MTEYTRPATWDDVKRVVSLLNEAGVAYALIGGYALAAHGYVRFSEDVDVLVDPSPENARKWIAALAQLPDGASKELASEEDIFVHQGPYAVRINDVFTVDVLPAACGHGWDELRHFIEQREVDGIPIRVLSLEGLLLTKEGMRDQDRADRRVLEAGLAALRDRK
jgi:aminoglycoside-2''-adenylyltransferase